MTELRQKMIGAMELKNFAHHTQRSYLSAVNGLAKYYQQSPDVITDKMLEDYLLYLKNVKGNAQRTAYRGYLAKATICLTNGLCHRCSAANS